MIATTRGWDVAAQTTLCAAVGINIMCTLKVLFTIFWKHVSDNVDRCANEVGKDKKKKICLVSWTDEWELLPSECIIMWTNDYSFQEKCTQIMESMRPLLQWMSKLLVYCCNLFLKKTDRVLCVSLEDEAWKALSIRGAVVREKPMWSYNHNTESKIFRLSLVPLISFPCKALTSPTMVLPFVGFFNNITSVNCELPV